MAAIEDGFVELCFDRSGAPINLFDADTVAELEEAVAAIAATPGVRGVLATSAKDEFIVGADVAELVEKFRLPHADLVEDVRLFNEAFVALEDLTLPTVVAVDGDALGGGFEFALACALRVMSRRARVGLPEVGLGLFPGLGGTVRLPRVAGARTAVQWVADGQPRGAEAALAAGAADAVCDSGTLRGTALALLQRAADGGIDWRAAQQRKRRPLNGHGGASANGHASAPALEGFAEWRASAAVTADLHQPAARAAVDLMERTAPLDRDAALALESEAFARIARTQAAAALVQTFLNQQTIRKIVGHRTRGTLPVKRAAVLGAGVTGRGIALTSACAGITVRLGDHSSRALQAARVEIGRQLAHHVETRHLSSTAAQTVRHAITMQTGHAGFDEADILIEAVIERLDVKRQVLEELEDALGEDAVLVSATRGLRIDDLAGALRHPERLVGLHFFDPVTTAPLVEVVRGSVSSERAVATAVAWAQAMNKVPVVVKDGSGFLVGRVLTAGTGAARRLIADGVDQPAIDRAMEAFGWPIGASYLQGVLGIGTDSRAAGATAAGGLRSLTDEEIVDRLMMPFIVEAAHTLAEGVVATPAELDMALQLALGCPAHIGGALEYADWLGLDEVVRRCDALRVHGPMYDPTPRMRQMAAAGDTFYRQASFIARGS